MDIQQTIEAVTTTAAVTTASSTSLLDHLLAIKEFILLIFTTLIGLVVYAWTRMEKSVDRCADAIEEHASKNEDSFDKVFSNLREVEQKLNNLLGEHKSCSEQIKTITDKCIRPGGCA